MKLKDESTQHPLFLNLLSAAIWNKPANSAPFEKLSKETWRGIVDIANEQSVSALVADKALSLPAESLPPRALSLQFMVMIKQTEALNRKMIHVLSDLINEYKEANFPFCLLKGLSTGINYPSPLYRNSGDIDLYLYQKGDFERATEWFTKKGFVIEHGDRIHNKFIKDGVWVENHSRIIYFNNKKYDIQFKKWEKELIEKNNFTFVQIDNLMVKQLPLEMNAFYIFQHLFQHFVHGGVGFRQFCDWLLFLSKHKGKISADSFSAIAKSYALLYPMQVFARAAVKYLDAPETIFPFEMIHDDKHADWIIADIFQGGNFGFYHPGEQRPKGKLRSLWFSTKRVIKRSKQFGEISPEHSQKLPFNLLVYRLKSVFKWK